jgi:hypothetical protein
MTVMHLYVRCARCGAREHLYSVTTALLAALAQHEEPPTPLSPAPAKAWMLQHEAEEHAPDEATRRDIDRWLLGYRKNTSQGL